MEVTYLPPLCRVWVTGLVDCWLGYWSHIRTVRTWTHTDPHTHTLKLIHGDNVHPSLLLIRASSLHQSSFSRVSHAHTLTQTHTDMSTVVYSAAVTLYYLQYVSLPALPRSLSHAAAIPEVFGGSASLPEGLRLIAPWWLRVSSGLNQREERRPVSHWHPQTEETCHWVATVTIIEHYQPPKQPPVTMVTSRIATKTHCYHRPW